MAEIKLESIHQLEQLFEVLRWCETTFGPSKLDRLGRWIGGSWCLDKDIYWTFKFVNNKDATLFALKWT
jgi:hypothetical protein